MADVFISHASSDVDVPRHIASLLTDAGYSVWWDHGLVPGERFRETIVRQLNDARAVVVVWSTSSVRSDWVYSEARRANKQDKLVQLRDPGLGIDDLPAPFDAFHCPSIDDEGTILAGVASVVDQPRAIDRRRRDESHPRPNLPGARTPIVGRDAELQDLRELLERGERLITLTGPGGSGKTMLAIEVARLCQQQFPAGVVFVALVTALDTTTAWSMIGEVLGLPDELRSREGTLSRLAEGRQLLVLDNLEQLDRADELVDALIESTAACSVLATSRRPLHVLGEREFLVPPLSLASGDGLEAVRSSGAAQMFVDHAQRVRRDFALDQQNARAIAELCRRLDGLPLAIELVAARMKLQTPVSLLQDLGKLIDVESASRPRTHRQATMRRTISWSYDALTRPQQRVIDCFGVFEGGASIGGLEVVVSDDDLEGHDVRELVYDLVDLNLISARDSSDGQPRYGILETIRQFTRDGLVERGVLESKLDLHSQHFYELARTLYEGARSRRHGVLRTEFEEELPNLRAMLATAAGRLQDPSFYDGPVPHAHVAVLVAMVCLRFGREREAHQILVATLGERVTDPFGEVAVRRALSNIELPDVATVDENYVRRTAAMAAALPDADLREWVAPRNIEYFALQDLMVLAQEKGDLDSARRLCQELVALAERGTPRHRALAHEAVYFQAVEDGDLETARNALELARRGFEAIEDEWGLALSTNNLADLERRMGRHDEALQRLVAGTENVVALANLDVMTTYLETYSEVIGVRAPRMAAMADGAAAELRETTGRSLEAHFVPVHQGLLAPAQEAAGVDGWRAAFEEGRSRPPAEVLRDLAAEMALLP